MFKPIDDIIAANAAHNRIVKLIAREEGAPLIYMAAGVDGQWDDDLYLDIVHFTERGDEKVAALMFKALLPILAGHGVSMLDALTGASARPSSCVRHDKTLEMLPSIKDWGRRSCLR